MYKILSFLIKTFKSKNSKVNVMMTLDSKSCHCQCEKWVLKPFQSRMKGHNKRDTAVTTTDTECSRNDPDKERFLPFTTAFACWLWRRGVAISNMKFKPFLQMDVWIAILNNILSFILSLFEYQKRHIYLNLLIDILVTQRKSIYNYILKLM